VCTDLENGKKERVRIRCYLHRSQKLVLKDHTPAWGGEYHFYEIEGICRGKVGGLIILEECYLVKTAMGGDW
jgi:hypothetical protein